MSRYRVLKSVAHNCAHSFVSAMNMGNTGYVMCDLLHQSRRTGANVLIIDVLGGTAEPPQLAITPVADAVTRYQKWFDGFVASSGSTLAAVRAATMTIVVAHGHPVGIDRGTVHAQMHATMTIIDDRDRPHVGSHIEPWVCNPQRGDPAA